MSETDWAEWSRGAAQMMQSRNREWQERWALPKGAPYRWDLDCAELVFRREADLVVASVTLAGTHSKHEGSFLWAWANETMPRAATRDLDEVQGFGHEHALGLLTDSEWPAGHPEALEAACLAGRILDAAGVFVDDMGDVTLYFVLRGFEVRALV